MLRKRMTVVLVAAVCALALGRPAAQQRDIGGIGITVFEDRNFRGENATFLQDTPTLGSFRLDNRISSLRVGPGEMWEACEEAYFRGRCQVFSGTESDLGRVRWDNRISSLRRVQGGGGYQPPRPPMGSSAVLYRGTGAHGGGARHHLSRDGSAVVWFRQRGAERADHRRSVAAVRGLALS